MKITVGLSEIKISRNPGDVLSASSLGSDLGIALHDQAVPVGALARLMLPRARVYPDMAKKNPVMFVDTGWLKLMEKIGELGASQNRLVIALAGGADFIEKPGGLFCIGKQNCQAALALIEERRLRIQRHELGGKGARTLSLEVGTGRIQIDSARGM